jgi:DNA-binding transcriptional ArsR family regulator
MSINKTLKAVSDPVRREILNILKNERMAAGDIVNHFDISGAAISRHLSILKEADLIRDTRDGKYIYYELNTSVFEDVLTWISSLKGGDNNENK